MAVAATTSVTAFSQEAMNTVTVPPALRPPAEQALIFELTGNGVRICVCAGGGTQAAPFGWKFQGPEAQQLDRAGQVVRVPYSATYYFYGQKP